MRIIINLYYPEINEAKYFERVKTGYFLRDWDENIAKYHHDASGRDNGQIHRRLI